MLFMYFLFRNEAEPEFNSSYANKLNFSDVLDTVNFNRLKFQSYATIVDHTFERLQEEIQLNIHPLSQQKNEEIYAELNKEMQNSEDEGNEVVPETQSSQEELILVITEYHFLLII